jgi:hypothetical protein
MTRKYLKIYFSRTDFTTIRLDVDFIRIYYVIVSSCWLILMNVICLVWKYVFLYFMNVVSVCTFDVLLSLKSTLELFRNNQANNHFKNVARNSRSGSLGERKTHWKGSNLTNRIETAQTRDCWKNLFCVKFRVTKSQS